METTTLLIAVLVATSIFAALAGIHTQRNQKRFAIAAAMNQMSAQPTNLRDLEMARSSSERLLKPLLRRLHGLGRIVTPSRNLEQLQRDLIMAGLNEKFSVTDFMGLRVLVGAGMALLSYLYTSTYPMSSVLLFALSGFMVGLYLPNIWLKMKVKARQKLIMRLLPDSLDMMSICVDAGLGFEAAIQKVGFQWETELAYEFRQVIRELRVGVSRVDALRNLAERTGVPEIATFVAVLIQADRLGIAIRDVLHTQAEQMRIRRRQRAEEEAAKTPLKMMFPMVFFIFPAMFAVILGPAIPRLMSFF
ncbi:MAG: type II secretion system F family protein [Caldilineaceae bacterium]|nr:type II secretion system F family protein [Caldilineaceae bacterium]